MLILSGGVGHLRGPGMARQTARPAAPRQEHRARAARPARQRHQLRLGRTREHLPCQRPGSMRAGQERTDSGQRHGQLCVSYRVSRPPRESSAPEGPRLMRRDPGVRPRRPGPWPSQQVSCDWALPDLLCHLPVAIGLALLMSELHHWRRSDAFAATCHKPGPCRGGPCRRSMFRSGRRTR
jgi:hypothetical protein